MTYYIIIHIYWQQYQFAAHFFPTAFELSLLKPFAAIFVQKLVGKLR